MAKKKIVRKAAATVDDIIKDRDEEGFGSHFDVVGLLSGLLTVLRTLAQLTATTIDDNVVAVLESILNNDDLIALVNKLLHNEEVLNARGAARDEAIRKVALKAESTELRNELSNKSINWQQLLDALPTIIRLILSMIGQRPATT